MILKSALFVLLLPALTHASGLDLLIGGGGEKKVGTTELVQYQKKISLDDAFKIQLYGAHRSIKVKDIEFDTFVEMILENKYQQALKTSYAIKRTESQMMEILEASKIYLLWKNQLAQTFFDAWLEIANEKDFINTQFGLAIDQIVDGIDSSWFFKNAISINETQLEKLNNLQDKKSYFNDLAQAYSNLRSGERSLELIGKIKANDPIKLKLAQTAIIHYAKTGKLSKSARILKEIVEPALSKTDNIEVLSDFHLTLARLLYQAQAYEAAEHYYKIIPEQSKQYLQANIESLWISLRSHKYEKIKGHLKSLSLDIYKDKFIPEVYLVSSMANLYLCQFSEVKNNIDEFVDQSKMSIKAIEKNLSSGKPDVIHTNDLFYSLAQRSIKNLKNELVHVERMTGQENIKNQIQSHIKLSEARLNQEVRKQWNNRKIILENAIRKMRFVKVEFLSQMRRLNKELKISQMQDSVKTISAGVKKTDKFYFPYDGVLFGDEVFNITSEVKDICLRGKK